MSTELAVYQPSQFLALDGGDAAMRAAMESVGEVETFGPNDLTRVKLPSGGATNWTIDGPRTEVVPEITGVLCFVQKYGVLWPSLEPTDGAQPVLRTFDLARAEQVGPIPAEMIDVLEPHRLTDPLKPGPQYFDWTNLPYNQFGTGKDGNGKRVKESRLLFILRPNDVYPMIVNCPAGSLRTWRPFFMKLPQATGRPYWYSVVTLGLEKARSTGGQPFARIIPKLAGTLDEASGDRIFQNFTSKLSEIAVSVADDVARDAAEEEEAF